MTQIDSKIPQGPLAEKWTNYKNHQKLVNPANKRRLDIIVVGTGLAGASAAASLAEMGFNVLNFCIQDSPRRAHSIAARNTASTAAVNRLNFILPTSIDLMLPTLYTVCFRLSIKIRLGMQKNSLPKQGVYIVNQYCEAPCRCPASAGRWRRWSPRSP